jgi:mannose-1-phosphate guanylyltransferase
VARVVIGCGYLPTAIEESFGSRHGTLDITYCVEPEPLGTGGGIRFAASDVDGTFLALNGDVLHGADLGAMVQFHRDRNALGTILLAPVADPSRYGLVRLNADRSVRAFLEKPRPEEIDTNLINAGLYVLEPEVLDLIPAGEAVSIERDVFPRIVEQGRLFGFELNGYWLDIGTPEAYLQAHRDVLERNFPSELGDLLGRDYTYVDDSAQVSPDARLVPPVYVGANAVIEGGVRIGSLAVIGAGAQIGAGSVVEHAVVQAGARLGRNCSVRRSLVAEDAELGDDTSVLELSVVGPGARVGEGNRLDGGLRIAAAAVVPPGAISF